MASKWRRCRLRDLCTSIDYGLTASAQAAPVGPRFLRITDIVSGAINWGAVPYVQASDRECEKYVLRHGDIVIARTGATTGCSACILHPPESVFASYLVRFAVAPEHNPRFVGYLLKGQQWWDYVRGVLGDKSAQPNASASTLADAWLNVPDRRTQDGIADVLGALDDKIAANTTLARLLEERLAALFATLGLDESGDNFVKLSMLLELNPQRSKPNEKISPYIDMAALPTESALVSTPRTRPSKSGTRFVNGDTVMARITPCLENGKTAYIDCLAEGEVGIGSTEFIVLRPKAGLPAQFAYFLARSPRFRDFAVRHMSGSSGRQRCPAGALAWYELSRPTASALAEFAEQVDPSFATMRAVLDESLVLAELRDVLLPRLLSGELHVREAYALVGEAV
jgi:type I restriction enzyme, S subunit